MAANWNPVPENVSDVGLDYQGVLRIGGRDTTQNFIQTRTSLRDDYSRKPAFSAYRRLVRQISG